MSDDGVLEARIAAIAALDDLIAGRTGTVAEFRRAWPDRGGGDPLLRRALLEGTHALVTGGDLEREIVALVRRMLEEGGTPAAYEAAYDALVRDAGPRHWEKSGGDREPE